MAGGSLNLVCDLEALGKLILVPLYKSIAKYYPGPGFFPSYP